MTRRPATKMLRETGGASATEFAFVFPLFLMFVFGVVEFGQGLRLYNELASVASRASRMVMLDVDVSNSTLETRIRTLLSELTSDELQVALSTDTVSGTDYRVVNISYPHQFVTPFLEPINVTLSVESRTPHGT